MNLIDLHCDTLNRIHESGKNISLHENDFHVDIKKLVKANSVAQFFALFADKNEEDDLNSAFKSMINQFYNELYIYNSEIAFA